MNSFDNNQIAIREVGAVSAMTREQADIQSAIVTAKQFPRSEAQAFEKAMRSFERRSLAEAAQYKFPRGTSTVSGPSVDCARELARCWGNVRYGLSIVSLDDEYVHIQGWASDIETNNKVVAEDKFKKKIQRKRDGVTTWVEPDERDLRELINRRGAICVRNAILQILPPDLVEDAIKQANKTLLSSAKDALSKSRDEVIREIVLAYTKLGITPDLIEKRLGHSMSNIDEHELSELREIYKSIRDGQAKREDFFELAGEKEGLKERLLKKAGGKDKTLAEQIEVVAVEPKDGELL